MRREKPSKMLHLFFPCATLLLYHAFPVTAVDTNKLCVSVKMCPHYESVKTAISQALISRAIIKLILMMAVMNEAVINLHFLSPSFTQRLIKTNLANVKIKTVLTS